MKKSFSFFVFSLISLLGFSQNQFAGTWQGMMDAGQFKLDVIFRIVQSPEAVYTATMDIPMQKAKGIKATRVETKQSEIEIFFDALKASFSGKISGDEKTITGFWKQSGQDFTLNLIKVPDNYVTPALNRPQTPKEPFPYVSEDLVYTGKRTKLKYGATLTYPKEGNAFTAVVLITGSGQQDRDETIFEHKSFAVIADYLSRNGIAVLRVDDRGIGKSTGDFSQSTSADFADDVREHVTYLRSLKQIDPKKIALIGHSEGGMIAPMLAAKDQEIAFVVTLAGPGVPIVDLMVQQNGDVLRSSGMDEKTIGAYLPYYRDMVLQVSAAKNEEEAKTVCSNLLEQWIAKTSPEIVSQMIGVSDEKSKKEYVESTVTMLNSPWWKFFLNYDPSENISKMNCPVLALNGSRDIQVSSKPNLEGFEKNLKKSGNKQVTTKEFEGLNHLFQSCSSCTVSEYATIETTIEPQVLSFMLDWIKALK